MVPPFTTPAPASTTGTAVTAVVPLPSAMVPPVSACRRVASARAPVKLVRAARLIWLPAPSDQKNVFPTATWGSWLMSMVPPLSVCTMTAEGSLPSPAPCHCVTCDRSSRPPGGAGRRGGFEGPVPACGSVQAPQAGAGQATRPIDEYVAVEQHGDLA